MRIFAIADTHLSQATPKPMDMFGAHWRNHQQRIRDNWNALAAPDDLLLVPGDISWALRLSEAVADLEFLAAFGGRKLLLKGNHDYWWSSLKRLRATAPAGIEFLQNDAHIYGDIAVAGARGWLLPDSPGTSEEDRRIAQREVERLRLSLSALRGRRYEALIVMMHFPPLRRLDEATPFTELIAAAGAQICVYGHLHGRDIETAAQGSRQGVEYRLVSADALTFVPQQVWPRRVASERSDEQR